MNLAEYAESETMKPLVDAFQDSYNGTRVGGSYQITNREYIGNVMERELKELPDGSFEDVDGWITLNVPQKPGERYSYERENPVIAFLSTGGEARLFVLYRRDREIHEGVEEFCRKYEDSTGSHVTAITILEPNEIAANPQESGSLRAEILGSRRNLRPDRSLEEPDTGYPRIIDV